MDRIIHIAMNSRLIDALDVRDLLIHRLPISVLAQLSNKCMKSFMESQDIRYLRLISLARDAKLNLESDILTDHNNRFQQDACQSDTVLKLFHAKKFINSHISESPDASVQDEQAMANYMLCSADWILRALSTKIYGDLLSADQISELLNVVEKVYQELDKHMLQQINSFRQMSGNVDIVFKPRGMCPFCSEQVMIPFPDTMGKCSKGHPFGTCSRVPLI